MLCNLPILSQFQNSGGIRSVSIPILNLMTRAIDGRFGDSRAVGEIFNCPVRVLGAGRYQSYLD